MAAATGVDLADPEAASWTTGRARAPRPRSTTTVTTRSSPDRQSRDGEVERTGTQQGVQPPLTRAEATEAARC
ncbi:hypothetical protein [Streptomyces sp. F001]|uniref:hypothetical protein n=1 Tax=Streptomyces sp. F001 TaxID=1510026 RepID=UPI001F109194|nr:hypothetical protein [Streptomyces sp. F001]